METLEKNPETHDPFEEVRAVILPQALSLAVFEGFTASMLEEAAEFSDVDRASLKAAFPGGVKDLLTYWTEETNETCRKRASKEDFDSLKIREKVAALVLARLDHLEPHKEAARRAAAYLSIPGNHTLGAQLAWSASDAIWRALNDTSTDFNFYSKRAILTGVWTSTLAFWFADNSDDMEETKRFLDDRIGNVMQIEKAKAKIRKWGIDPAAPISWLAKLRYPAP